MSTGGDPDPTTGIDASEGGQRTGRATVAGSSSTAADSSSTAAGSSSAAAGSSSTVTEPQPTAAKSRSTGGAERPRVLFVDNFDSFTYNLVEYVSEYAETEVVRNTVSLETVVDADPDAVVISPGPGHPENERDVGVTTAVLREVSPEVPTLGVCLGLEAAIYAYGGTVGRAPEPVHGKAVGIHHDGEGVFAGLEQGFQGGRYHSLVATEVPSAFVVTATATVDGEDLVMGIRHREYPIAAVQFHPESVLTAVGHEIVGNFLAGV